MSFLGLSLQMSVNNGSTYARNNLRHFNINHVTKIPHYTQGKDIKKHHQIFTWQILQNNYKGGKKLHPLISPYVIQLC